MTLNITVEGIEKSLISKGIIYVDQGQAGTLVSPKFSSKTYDFKQKNRFLVKCSYKDNLVFKVCEETKNLRDQTYVGSAKFFASVFLKNYEKSLLQNDYQTEYQIDVYTPAQQYAGTIKMKIHYDKSQVFMGEIAGQTRTKPAKSLPIYKGACPSKNFFNCLDTQMKGRQMKFMESIYKDDMENMPE